MVARVFLVDLPSGLAVLRRIMAGYDLSEVKTLESAKEQLERTDIDLIVVGIHFDDSRAVDFMKAVREHENHKETPVVMVRSLPSDMADFLRHCIREVSKLYRISSYIETDHFQTNQAIREAIEAALPANKRSPLVRSRTKEKAGKILIAASPELRAKVERMISDHHEAYHASTVEEATRLLENTRFDGIVCTILFDDARIFDLLRMVRSNRKWKDIPFVCARVRPGTLDTPSAVEGIKSACELHGATGFVNISDYNDEPEPEQLMADAIERYLCSENSKGSH